MSIVSLMLINCFFITALSSQNNPDSLKAAKLFTEAEALAKQEQYSASSEKALAAADAFERLLDWDNSLEGYRLILTNGYYDGDYATPIQSIGKGLAKVPKERPGILAKMDYFLAYAYYKTGDVFSSVEHYENSLSHFITLKDTVWQIALYGNLSIGYMQIGDYAKAVDHAKNSIYLGKHTADTETKYRNLKALADAYFYHEDLINAQKYYQEAQKIYDPKDGTFEYKIAKIYLQQQKPNEAFAAIRQSLQLTRKRYGNDLEATAELEKTLGEIYLYTKQPQLALNLFLKILPYYKTDPNKRELGKLYILIADTQRNLMQYDQSLASYQMALKTFLPHFQNNEPESNPDEKLMTNEIWFMEIFSGKGDCFLKKYQLTKDTKWLVRAEEHYQLAIDFIQRVKLNFDETASKLSLGDYTRPFYEDLVKVKLQLFKTSQNPKYKEDAFQIVQTANAYVLRELLNEQEAFTIAGIAPDTIELLENIRAQELMISRKIKISPDSIVDALLSEQFQLKREQQNLKQAIEKNYPEFVRLRNDLKVATSTEIQEKLDDASLFIKYFLGENTLFLFSISKSGFLVDTIALPPDFATLIYQYRRAVSDLDFITKFPQIAEQEFLYSAHQLYKTLLEKPLLQHAKNQDIQRLSIVADGLLNTIQFQALLLRESDSWTNPDNFVISEYAISYNYFSKMLLDDSENQDSEKGFVSFGLEFDDYTLEYLKKTVQDSVKNEAILDNLRSGSLAKLPFSDDEAKELAALMNGKSWLNEDATKLNFLEQAPLAGIIHLATHSVVDQINPNQSALIFIKKKDGLDNLLRQEEIYHLRSDAALIVLSACNTAYGQGRHSEGLNSLARAFNFAGIPSVTATSWSISDEASKKMMVLYYQYLKEGRPKDMAMQKAQLTYLKNDAVSSPAFRLPVYWAAWMPVGNRDKIIIKSNSFLWAGSLFLAALLLIGLLLFVRKVFYNRP